MYTDVTYQDWLLTPEYERPKLLEKIIAGYRASADFQAGLTANAYFRAENPVVMSKTILRARKAEYKDASGRKRAKAVTEDVVGNRIASAFLYRFVTQQNQFLLSEGVTLKDDATKKKLGLDFDEQLEQLGEKALLHGVAWGFWNAGKLEIIEAVKDNLSGAVALVDERTSEPMALVQFWRVNPQRPMYVRLFTVDGVVEYRENKDKELEEITPLRPYVLHTQTDALGTVVTGGHNYVMLPVRPLCANSERRSELTPAIKSKIDAYDRILSDFADNLDRANDVYWVLNNFGGSMDDVAELLEQINRLKAVSNLSDGTGAASTAEPHTIEVPYAAREKALDLLEKALYQDYMALDMDELTGGSLTNVAIRAATANLNLKANRYEWQVRQFVRQILLLAGIESDEIRFKRQTIANESETVADIAVMRQDIDQRTALKLNPYIQEDEIDQIMGDVDAEVISGKPTMDELEKMLEEARKVGQE